MHRTKKSFLSNTLQRVKSDSINSYLKKDVTIVPHGTVLGTLLFNLYLNNLCTAIDSNVKKIHHADYCLIFASNKD